MQNKLSKAEWATHSLIGGAIVILLLTFRPPQGANINFYTILTLNIALGIIVFYSHILWLTPNFLAHKKYGAYIKKAALMLISIGMLGLGLFAGIDALFDVMPAAWSVKLAIAIPLVFIAFSLLLVMPITFAYLMIRDWVKKKTINKYAEIGLHLFFGGVFWVYLFQRLPYWDIHEYPKPFYASLAYASLMWIGSMGLFYANALWCIPKYLARKKIQHYFLTLFGILIVGVVVDGLLASQVRWFQVVIGMKIIEPFVMSSFWIKLLLVLPFSFFYRFTKDWISSLLVKQRLAITELAYLKNQIKPHFLFNTLNSLYSTAIMEDSPMTADSLVRLSNLMRYALHESEKNSVSLRKELDYLDDYITLQLTRLPEHICEQIEYSCTGYVEGFSIAPMLLVTFIENCFQHGIYTGKDTAISIAIAIEEDVLSLTTRNPIFQAEQERHGIGLANTIKRLEVAYPEKHHLQQSEEEGYFIVQLSIQLS